MSKIVIWCGNGANQVALANKIASRFPVAGIVVEKKTSKRKISDLPEKLLDRTVFKLISDTWRQMMKYYADRYPSFPDVPSVTVNNINSEEAYAFTEKIQPDLIIVSGTSMVKKKMLSVNPSIGIINLHTGLSPYVKGGPNCTNWCIANNQPGLIGNTIMWINEGIDSGNIITTRKTELAGCRSAIAIHLAVMEDAHKLYLEAIDYLLSTQPPYISVDQKSLGKGKLYLTRMWKMQQKLAFIRNIKKIDIDTPLPAGVSTIELPSLKPVTT